MGREEKKLRGKGWLRGGDMANLESMGKGGAVLRMKLPCGNKQ